MQIRWILRDLEPQLIQAWEEAFLNCSDVDVSRGDILTADADAIVSPANSFGFMDGGLDLVYSQAFGWDLEAAVREALFRDYDGELPVGQALLVPMSHPRFRYLICAPTMRVPHRVDKTVNSYLAFRAIMRATREHNATRPDPIHAVACPGLGTGVGAMPPRRCALQMREAYEAIIHGRALKKGGLAAAARQHMRLVGWEPSER